jgi:ABC-type transport system involved in cytochrome bd biosynthesis fused ATPase/permease subunit
VSNIRRTHFTTHLVLSLLAGVIVTAMVAAFFAYIAAAMWIANKLAHAITEEYAGELTILIALLLIVGTFTAGIAWCVGRSEKP